MNKTITCRMIDGKPVVEYKEEYVPKKGDIVVIIHEKTLYLGIYDRNNCKNTLLSFSVTMEHRGVNEPYLLEENAMFYGLPIFLATPEESEVMHHILNENGYELKGDAVVKKRWIPKVGEDFYYLVNKHDGIQAVKGRRFYEADSGYLDCFKTEQACQSACDKLNEFILTLPQE